MKRIVLALFATAAGLCAQSHSVAAPGIGFFADATGGALNPILGVPGAARLGAAIPAAGFSALYVAPRGMYVLASAPGASVSIASLRPADIAFGLEFRTLAAVLPGTDLVAFSPGGASAALYSRESNTVQVLTGLPGSPHVAHNFPVSAALLQVAVSDDGEALLARQADGTITALPYGETLYKVQSSAAITFMPGNRDAILTDTTNNSLVKLAASGGTTIPASGLSAPDALAVTSDGSTLVTGSGSRKSVWTVNLNSGETQEYPVANTVKTLQALAGRDTFLVTYQDGSHGLLCWWKNRLTTHFIGALRSGVN